ncbi:MAG TPA: GAF domain-containing protein [Oscillatoriaceae cyanobacterium M33_DOE_052]|uniref:Circadian input-output histidine kinase CikA n=1 Tax=Planktothricoides sp. SpSt-374 TaxID=2282167 RepID=A0A7C3ZPA2_9CYAN|nr:GAF domain-containing protein [Oscillatoriaceae cyanobacterium M33_DOE_052]
MDRHAGEGIQKEALLYRMTNRIRQSLELETILMTTAAELRSFLQTDRVKVYRFEPDGSGEVIAESVARLGLPNSGKQRLPSLLGLHFPASDIPPHSREMFVKARTRVIVNISAQQITLNNLGKVATTGDLTVEEVQKTKIEDILQRPVDPCHVEYLTNMGVQSSLVVPIFHGEQLWGLLAAHHATPKIFTDEDLLIVQLLADQVSVALGQSHLLSEARAKTRQETLINQISTLLHTPQQVGQILENVLKTLVKASGCSGGRLYLHSTDPTTATQVYTYGDQPQIFLWGTQPQKSATGEARLLEDEPFWLHLMAKPNHTPNINPVGAADRQWLPLSAEQFSIVQAQLSHLNCHIVPDLYQEPLLASVAATFRNTPIRSILVMPLWYGKQALGGLTLFRDEIDTEIFWAGRFDPDDRNLRVRQSFEAWQELKLGQTPQWHPAEIELVQAVGSHLGMALMQNRLYQWERENRLLVEMRNRELDAARNIAEEANRLKSDFLSSTSHELRTPLASTLNYLKLLKEGFYDNEEELKEYIGVAYQSAENLVAIINDVLDIAKIEAGRMNVQMKLVETRPLLEEQIRLFSIESKRKGIPLILQCEAEQVYTDQGKLKQILTNLLSNALKFTHRGEIRLTARNAAAMSLTGDWVEIVVADTGIGIDTNQREHLFEPFVQADGSIKRRYGGTGLGLTICKRLAELIGGHIFLESEGLGMGTKVRLLLPQGQNVV